jgi:hypothetical protein
VEQAAALPPEELAEWDEAAVLPQAAERAVSAPPQEAVVAEHAVARPQAEAASVAAAVLQQVVEAAPGAPAALPSVAPSAAAWAFHPDQPPPWLAPRPAERSARARGQRPVAAR